MDFTVLIDSVLQQFVPTLIIYATTCSAIKQFGKHKKLLPYYLSIFGYFVVLTIAGLLHYHSNYSAWFIVVNKMVGENAALYFALSQTLVSYILVKLLYKTSGPSIDSHSDNNASEFDSNHSNRSLPAKEYSMKIAATVSVVMVLYSLVTKNPEDEYKAHSSKEKISHVQDASLSYTKATPKSPEALRNTGGNHTLGNAYFDVGINQEVSPSETNEEIYAQQGLNSLENYNEIMVLGRQLPRCYQVENQARAL